MRRKFLYGTPLDPIRAGTMAMSERSAWAVPAGRTWVIGWLIGRPRAGSARDASGLVLPAVLVPEFRVVGVLTAGKPRAAGRVVKELRRAGHMVEDVPLGRQIADLLVGNRLEAMQ